MGSKNRAAFRGRKVCDRCGQEWFWDELTENVRGQQICKNCWDPEDGGAYDGPQST